MLDESAKQSSRNLPPNFLILCRPLNHWRSTKEVISWIDTNSTPGHVQLLQFGIESFYPSISENFLDEALQFAQEHINISERATSTPSNRLSLLLCPRGETWQIKDSHFDITMGARRRRGMRSGWCVPTIPDRRYPPTTIPRPL